MSEELEVLAVVAGRLEAAGIAYMVTGSIAANCYTVPRMTRDIDVVVELAAGDVDRVLDLFGADFYVDRDAVREAVAHHGAVNLIHEALVLKVDLIVRKDTEYRRVEFACRRRTRVGEFEIAIVAPEDLIISKLDWVRDSRSADTPPEVEERYRALLMALPAERRLRMGASMNATARALVRASVRARHPDASETELRRALFLRFYGDDFSAPERERILAWLGRTVPSTAPTGG